MGEYCLHFFLAKSVPMKTLCRENAAKQRGYGAENIENILASKLIDAAIEVHKSLGGPGLLESVYEEALCHELIHMGLFIQRQVLVPLRYKGILLRDPMRLDLLVNKKLIVEIKATTQEHDVHKAQLLTYLRLSGLKLGLIINFGLPRLHQGIKRVVNAL